MSHTDWMARARCRTTDPTPWVDEHKPNQANMRVLAAICAQCPVRTQCAAYALEIGASGGVYAGVYVPHTTHRYGVAWIRAQERLASEVAAAVAS